ncbi:Z band alternatively spliced PDZ-motif protein 52 isoform X7 [Haematobia irritans]|uniref:Z band alternatively spliced PDZ-motif protein 52 isoform X7 n=1 Tax=Haematobia irritans TaxID=7368 RepID=UPI003F50C081
MAQPQMMQIKLSRFDAQPWGFRLQGGTDFAQPLLVQKVNGGSLAEKAGLMPGDAVIKINDVDVFNLRHKDAQDIVVRSGNNFVMTVQRGGSTWRPHVQLTGNVPHPNAGNLHTVTKTSLAHKQQEVQHIGSGYNNSARPFGGSAVDGNVKSIVNKQYNTPVGIYSDESIAETLSAQAEVLAGGVLGVNFKKNEKEYQADKSEVLKFLREEESGTSTPEPPSATSYYATKSHAIGGNELRSPQTEERITAKFQKPTTTQAPPPSAPAPSKVEIPVPTEPEQPDPRLIVMPVCPALQTPEYKEEMEKAAAAAADGDQPKPYTASGHPACSMCGVGIVGVFVRIKDKNLHVECFKCATCGTNLKNQGYYNFNNKLYCDIHAKLAALQNPPPGTEGYVPVPIKPNTKLSASTISSALNTHGYNNGVSNGSSTPTPAPAADMNLNDLPLPPPPSPTQLQQYEQDQGNVTNISNIPPPPPHTRTLSSLSSMSSGSNTTHSSTHSLSPTPYQYQHQGQGPCNNVIMQTHNITMDPYASTSPMHSRQTSSSSSSLNYASDNNYMTSPPPPPPPPLPLPSMLPPAAEDNRNGDLYIDTMKQQQNAIGSNNSSKLLTNRNNENDKNSYNKSGNGNGIGVGNGTTFQPNTHKVAPTAVTGPTSTITTTKSPSSSNIPIVDKSLINSNNTYNPESNTTTTTTTFNTGTNDMSSTMASSGPSVQPTSETSSNGVGGDKPFEYVTLTGNVIRSVVPPGKGTNVNYKVNNQGYARPYGAPPAAAPKSPVTFPPQTQQWNAPPPTQPKPSAPAGNPYATLPRSNVGQGQDETNEEGLQPQYAETYFEEDYEVEEANRQMRSNFCWPPQQDDSHRTPTAAPLYIPPPETQHVEVKPIENPPPPEIGEKKHTQPQQQQHQEQQKQPQHPQYQKSSQQGGEHAECRTIQVTQQQAQSQTQSQWQVTQQQAQSQTQWQSRSAPQLTVGVQSTECESGSDSYTSTCTTATTTSEEYQRMYAAQVQAYQMQQLYDQSGSEFDYHMDMEVASMQQSHDQLQLCSSEYLSGRRSAQDCVETLVPSLCTYKLVDMVREVTPSPVPQQSSSQGSRRVVFQDDPEVKVLETPTQQVQQQQEQQYQKQQQTSSYASNLTQASTKSSSASYTTMAYDKVATSLSKHEAHEVIEETAQDLEHSEVIFPPPSPLSHLHTKTSTGLHRPENIPKYQRNWTVLPSQSPVRTPEPHELRENVPLAFVDTPKTPGHSMGSYENTVHKPVAQMSTRTSSATNNNTTSSSTTNNNSNLTAHQQHTSASAYGSTSVMSSQADQRHQQSVASASSHSSHSMARPQATKPTTVPIIIEDRAGPVTMAFQPLDEHMVRDHSQTPSRPYTPSRPAPIVPRYQTPEKLCFDECPAAHARDYDFRSASPFPDRARSPACGPPPNPLAAIRAPRIKDPDVSSMSPRVLQAGSITTGQSYLGAQQAQKQEQILAHTESSSHSGMQSFSQQPEKKEEYQIGNMSVQKREQSSRMAEQQQRQMQSQTTTQVGNTQIERRRKVTEEYEHTSSAKTVEIRTGSQSSSTDRRQSTASYGKGYVANQARRLSGLEQEITNLTPQSQAISARAAHLTENKFPEFHSPEPLEKFPTKPLLPSYDEPKPPSYIVSGASTKSVANTSSSCYQQKQEQKQLSTAYGSSVFSSQQQQQQQQKSLTTYSSVSSSQQQQQQQVNTVSSSVTKASAATNNQAYKSITAGTNNQTATSSSSASTGICPVTGTFCRPGHTCCKQQSMHSNNNTNNNNNNNNVSNGAAYRPNASLGSASNASNFAANSQPPRQQQQQQSQATAPATKAPAASSASAPTTMSNQNNNGGSAGSTGSAGGMAPKGGSYGATSAPKRGRGVMNKPAGPGVRIPLCNSCGTQVRGPFITALGKIWCPEHFHCTNGNCRRPLQDIGFVEEKGDLYCEYCFEKYLAPGCSKCGGKIKGDCLNAIGKHFHPECFSCGHCGKLFGNTPFFLEDGMPYCEADWNELFTTKCFACGFPVEAGDRWVEALNHNYHSQCFNCTYCKQNLEGQSFYNKGGRPFCKNHAR